jgi:hypothetical protein
LKSIASCPGGVFSLEGPKRRGLAKPNYNGRENLDTKTGENKLDSRHYEKTTFARIQSQSGP